MKYLWRLFSGLIVCAAFLTPGSAVAGNIVDALNLAPFVPYVLDSMMLVASGGYDFFVGNGDGIIYILIWGFLGITLTMYLLKLYLPKQWASLFGFSGGQSLADGNVAPMTIAENMLKPGLRAVIAVVALLQIKPVYLTEWLVNPFLQFGALYTHAITETINDSGMNAPKIECPADIADKGWLTQSSCEFLVQPVSDLSHANNQIIKKGFEFISRGLRGLITLVPHGGEDFMNLITGIILVFTFVSSNLFMAMLVINAIFKFGMALILYPFYVLTYVAKPSDKWFDIWPAFGGITKALQDLIITMIACAFILCINLAIIKSLFDWNSSVFVVAAGGSAASNIPTVANNSMGFGGHSLTWMSALLTFYLMFRIFEITQKQLKKYAPGMDGLYNQVRGDAKTVWKGAKDWGGKVGKAIGWIKKK